AELVFHGGEELLEAPGVEHVFEPRLEAVGAVAVLDEHAHDRVGGERRLRGFDEDAAIAGEVAMAGDAAEQQPEPNARLEAEAVLDLDRLEADVVRVLDHRDHSRAVEGDVELARDAIERTVVENVEVPFARV